MISDRASTVMCYDPVSTDDTPVFDAALRYECEAIGGVTKVSSSHSVADSMYRGTHSRQMNSCASVQQQYIPLCSAIILAEDVVSRVEMILGMSKNYGVLDAIGDMEHTCETIMNEKEERVKTDIQALELKLDSLSRLCRQQKLVSLPLEAVRSATNTLHLFRALHTAAVQLQSAVISVREMCASTNASRILCVDSKEAAAKYAEALQVKLAMDKTESALSSTEAMLGSFLSNKAKEVDSLREMLCLV